MSDKKRKVPKLRFPGFTDAWEQRKVGDFLTESRVKGSNGMVSKKLTVKLWGKGVVEKNTIYRGSEATQYYTRFSGQFIYGKLDFLNQAFGIIPEELDGYESTLDSPAFDVSPALNKDFFLDYVSREQFYLVQGIIANGSRKAKRIHSDTFFEMPILLPEFNEQKTISDFTSKFDTLISLHQRKLDNVKMLKKSLLQKLFPKDGEKIPELRFPGFTDAWEQRKLGDEFQKVNERNDGSFGREHWISVAKMYFQEPEKVQSNNIDTRTYVMRGGDIAFEGHPNSEFKFGRFVANDIGSGVVSELFPIYRHKGQYDNKYWKYAIQLERIMAPIFAKSITSSGNSSNKLEPSHFLRQSMPVATYEEQKVIGDFLNKLESLLSLHQRKLDHLKELKKGLLQQMFV